MAVEDVEDAEGQAVLQRVGASFARDEVELVSKVQAHIERHLPVVGVGEVIEGDFAPRKVSDVLAGRDGFPVTALQREGGADALPLCASVEDVAAVVTGRERGAVVDIGEGSVRLRPCVGQAPLQPGLRKMAFVQELGAVGRAAAHLCVVTPALGRCSEHRHCVGVVDEVLHLLVVAAQRHGVAA